MNLFSISRIFLAMVFRRVRRACTLASALYESEIFLISALSSEDGRTPLLTKKSYFSAGDRSAILLGSLDVSVVSRLVS